MNSIQGHWRVNRWFLFSGINSALLVTFVQPLIVGCNSYEKRLHENFSIKIALKSTEHLNLTQREPTIGVTFEQPLRDGCLRCIKVTL